MVTRHTLVLVAIIALYGHVLVANDGATISDAREEPSTVAPRAKRRRLILVREHRRAKCPSLSRGNDGGRHNDEFGPRCDSRRVHHCPGDERNTTTAGTGLPAVSRLIRSTLYTRFDYLDWGDHRHTIDQGPLFTLGYERSIGRERFRAEVFGSQTKHNGTFVLTAPSILLLHPPLSPSHSMLPIWEVAPNTICLRTRRAASGHVFRRHRHALLVAQPAEHLGGRSSLCVLRENQTTWVTVYPYIGAETRHNETRRVEFYGRARLGILAATYEHEFGYGIAGPTLFPGPGVTGQTELGIRGDRFLIAALRSVRLAP